MEGDPSSQTVTQSATSSSSTATSAETTTDKEPVKPTIDYHEGITYEVVTNDGQDESMIRLIALKNIFSKQLPKMPREYIVRLVLDHRHVSLAILRHKRIIGGICYRPYYEQRFGEIAFCAINSNEQVRGYGTALMNQLKVSQMLHK